MEVGGLKENIVPERDYYRGIPTILNSEKAAILVSEYLYRQLGSDEKFFDKDFGPKDENDEDGNKLSLYFNGQGPRGYAPAENVMWMRPEEYASERP